MGIMTSGLYSLIYAAEHGVNYKTTLMIGRQGIWLGENTDYALKKILKSYNPVKPYTGKTDYAEDLFRYFGADTVDSLDYSDYEGATIIHDLNIPVVEALKNKYTCVFDCGTLEHVFNYPAAIKNCMDMTAINGHFILHTPANNQFGHGFYQFSPELFFSLLHERNGFSETKIYMQNNYGHWFEVVDPRLINRRVDVCCSESVPSTMYIQSKKIAPVPEHLTVLQSDYELIWSKGSGDCKEDRPWPARFLNRCKKIVLLPYKKIIPMFIQERNFIMWRQLVLKRVFYKPVKQFQRQKKSREHGT